MNNSRLLGVLLLFVYLFNISSCGTLYAAQASEGDGLGLAQRLKGAGFDIYGFYGDLVIASPQTTLNDALNHMWASCLQVVVLGESNNIEYFVLERQEQYGVTFSDALSSHYARSAIYASFNRIVVSTVDWELLPRFVEVLPVPTAPIQLGIRDDLLSIVEKSYKHAALKYTTAPLQDIKDLVAAVNASELEEFVTYLTGEDPASNIFTRNSMSQGAKDSAVWIQKQFNNFGLTTTLLQFRTDYSPNVVGVKLGTNPSQIVVIGAHYDSRGTSSTSTTQRAPGANDNGSGTGALLQIAKVIHDLKATFDYTIHFVAYSGEEQGLYGSAAYATQLVNEKAVVVGVLNADMVAYRVPSETTQCAFPSRYSTPALESLAKQAVATYVPTLTIGTTTACCSDHQSYYNRGFPATGFFERNGPIADPQYHQSADLAQRTGYDFNGQYVQLCRAVLATLATVAQLHVRI